MCALPCAIMAASNPYRAKRQPKIKPKPAFAPTTNAMTLPVTVPPNATPRPDGQRDVSSALRHAGRDQERVRQRDRYAREHLWKHDQRRRDHAEHASAPKKECKVELLAAPRSGHSALRLYRNAALAKARSISCSDGGRTMFRVAKSSACG